MESTELSENETRDRALSKGFSPYPMYNPINWLSLNIIKDNLNKNTQKLMNKKYEKMSLTFFFTLFY